MKKFLSYFISSFKLKRGFTLIEVLIALTMIGIVGGTYYGTLGTIYKINAFSKNKSIELRIAQQQLEKIVTWDTNYDSDGVTSKYSSVTFGEGLPDSDINPSPPSNESAQQFYGPYLPPQIDVTNIDTELQKITITVSYDDTSVSLTGYKYNVNP